MGSAGRLPYVDNKLIQALERSFAKLAGHDRVIDARELQRALGLQSEYLAQRVLRAFDANGDGVITRDEFVGGVRRLIHGSDREKLAFAFQLHDQNGDGFIDRGELLRMIAISLGESDLTTRASMPPERLTHALLSTADTNQDGLISFAEFEAVVTGQPELLLRMTRSEAMWLTPSEPQTGVGASHLKARTLSRFFENEWHEVLFVFVWLVAMVALFGRTMLSGTPDKTHFLMQLGRASGACMNLCGALIFLPVMRRLLTKVRASILHRVVPVDSAITFHKLLGHTLFGFAVLHAVAFVLGYAQGHSEAWRIITTGRGSTGFALLSIFTVMWIFALGVVRRSRHFELFYFTHALYFVWIVLALIHAPLSILWFGIPLLGFFIEQLVRLVRRGRKSIVLETHPLRSGVTRLDIQKPKGFRSSAADYVFLRIPALAKYEWHPFTISSAPENERLTVHVRSLGNWTSGLRKLVETRESRGEHAPLEVYVDGPYGSPTAHIEASRFAVFIGAGIGVTPFASILESIALRKQHGDAIKLERGHFFWLNRDQYSFEWFVDLLSDIERIDHQRILDLHLCMTGGRAGGTAVGLEVAREILHRQGNRDIVTGLRSKTHMGHPDWDVVLGAIAEQHKPHAVDVFFCGPHGLAAKIAPICKALGMHFREEQF